MADDFRFRICKAAGGPHASVDAFKSTPHFTSIENAVSGKPEAVGKVYVSYKLYEGDVWVRWDFENEEERLAFRQYVIDSGADLGDFEAGKQSFRNQQNPDGFPTYGFLA
tara:strand:- start:749 stop:1078 length:330 start_codon:yes stop_codon:yes gene_type:complete